MKDNSTAQLLPCPFCGSEMESSHGAFGHIGGQPTCPIYYTAFDDAEAGDWNTRAPVSQDAAQLVERLRKLLPVSWDNETDGHGAPTHAVLTFGEHRTQAMTLCPDDWMVLNELPDLIEALTRVQPSTGLDTVEDGPWGVEHWKRRLLAVVEQRDRLQAAREKMFEALDWAANADPELVEQIKARAIGDLARQIAGRRSPEDESEISRNFIKCEECGKIHDRRQSCAKEPAQSGDRT